MREGVGLLDQLSYASYCQTFRALVRTVFEGHEEIRWVFMSIFPIHGEEAFQNYRQGKETTHENSDNFCERLLKQMNSGFEKFDNVGPLHEEYHHKFIPQLSILKP